MAGQGIALLPDFVVADALAGGHLVPILAAFDTAILNLYSLRPKDHMASHRLKLLHDFLHQHLNSCE
ncbi:LysR substrate-binding domain-containing protein [Photobacterium sagamiensis]